MIARLHFGVLFDVFSFGTFIGVGLRGWVVGLGGHGLNLLIKIICDLNLKSY